MTSAAVVAKGRCSTMAMKAAKARRRKRGASPGGAKCPAASGLLVVVSGQWGTASEHRLAAASGPLAEASADDPQGAVKELNDPEAKDMGHGLELVPVEHVLAADLEDVLPVRRAVIVLP